jgi:hypothetical protein
MPRPPAEIYDRVRLRLDDMIATALRADSAAIAAALKSAEGTAATPAIEFMGHARQLVLAATVALSAAVEAHRHVPGPRRMEICPSCGTTETCPTVRRVADTLAAGERGLLVGVHDTPLAELGERYRRYVNGEPYR